MYTFIFLDGSVSSMGNLLWALRQNKRVWLVLADDSERLKKIAHEVRDCCGNLCHFDNGTRIDHFSYTVDGNFTSLVKPEEMFFSIISEMNEEEQNEWLENTKICRYAIPCAKCERCIYCEYIAEQYGIYDAAHLSHVDN